MIYPIYILIILIIVGLLAFFYLKYSTWLPCSSSDQFGNLDKPVITFIIPSIGRPTIIRTIKSLQNLSNPNWRAIVVFDGVKSNISHIHDKRISYYEIKKRGRDNMAGTTRNYAINKVDNTDWIGFVDDDDTISPNYIDVLLQDSKFNTDCIVFHMLLDDRIVPNSNTTSLIRNDVGISFCVKTDILKRILFKNSKSEDYDLLERLSKTNSILLSNNLTYFVRKQPEPTMYNKIWGKNIMNPIRI